MSNYVGIATAEGNSWLLLTPTGKQIITNNIEAARLEKDELLAGQGINLAVFPWHGAAGDLVAKLTQGLKLGADGNYPGATNVSDLLAAQRLVLMPEERALYRQVCRWCGEAIEAATRLVKPGMSEHEIAGLLAREEYARGITPTVLLVAVDEHIWQFRHPLPTSKVMERYAMLVLGGRHRGLIGAASRLVHFGPLSDELKRKQEAVARIDATLIAASRPGARIADIFQRAVDTYAATGFADEWRNHHQGGAIGYESREYRGTPGGQQIVQLHQCFAWNPSVAGSKSEDTILVGENGNEIISATGNWPTIAVEVDGVAYPRPAILIR